MDQIPLCVPEVGPEETKLVMDCMANGWLARGGPFVKDFEHVLAEKLDASNVIACSSGTAALHVALQVAGIRPGDEVIVPALTFIAPANAVRYVGATPVFVDVDPLYWQLNPDCVQACIDQRYQLDREHNLLHNKVTGAPLKALLPVHLLGHPCDLDALISIAQRFNLMLIEDAAESLGAEYRERPVGKPYHIACLSFNGNKVITTGAGGALVTDCGNWAADARRLIDQGREPGMSGVYSRLGYNYRMPSLNAAVGCGQLSRLAEHVDKKRAIMYHYDGLLKDIPGLKRQGQALWALSTFWLYTVLIDENEFGMDSRSLARGLSSRGIETRPFWQPMHLSPTHRADQTEECPVAEELWRQGISLPSSVGLTEEQQDAVVEAIRAMGRKG